MSTDQTAGPNAARVATSASARAPIPNPLHLNRVITAASALAPIPSIAERVLILGAGGLLGGGGPMTEHAAPQLRGASRHQPYRDGANGGRAGASNDGARAPVEPILTRLARVEQTLLLQQEERGREQQVRALQQQVRALQQQVRALQQQVRALQTLVGIPPGEDQINLT
jgi:hypothetical protein